MLSFFLSPRSDEYELPPSHMARQRRRLGGRYGSIALFLASSFSFSFNLFFANFSAYSALNRRPRYALMLPGLCWHELRAQPKTYSALSIVLSSNGHHNWTSSSIGNEQFLHCAVEREGSVLGKNAYIQKV